MGVGGLWWPNSSRVRTVPRDEWWGRLQMVSSPVESASRATYRTLTPQTTSVSCGGDERLAGRQHHLGRSLPVGVQGRQRQRNRQPRSTPYLALCL